MIWAESIDLEFSPIVIPGRRYQPGAGYTAGDVTAGAPGILIPDRVQSWFEDSSVFTFGLICFVIERGNRTRRNLKCLRRNVCSFILHVDFCETVSRFLS